MLRGSLPSCSHRASCSNWHGYACPVAQKASRGRRARHITQYARESPPPSQDKSVLRNLEKELHEYCDTLDTQSQAECSQVQAWFHEKVVDTLDKSEPHTHPEPSDGPGSLSVEEDAQALRQRFRELALSGSVKDIYHALQVMKRLEDEQASGHVKSVRIRQLSVPLPVTSDPEGRALLVALFNKADADHNGRLTWQEFQNALHFINDDMSEEELELVSSALDLQGSVTLEQFLAIVETAEEERALQGTDAEFLRHVTHHHPADPDHIRNVESSVD